MNKSQKNSTTPQPTHNKLQATDQTPTRLYPPNSSSSSTANSNEGSTVTQKGNVAAKRNFLEQNLSLNAPINKNTPTTAKQISSQPKNVLPNNTNQGAYPLFASKPSFTPKPLATTNHGASAASPTPFQPLSRDELHQRIQAMVIYKDHTAADNQALIKAMESILQLKPSVVETHAMLLNALYLKTTLGAYDTERRITNMDLIALQSALLSPHYGKDFPNYSIDSDPMIKRLHNALIYLECHLDQDNPSLLSGNDALPLWQKFILSHCQSLLEPYLQEGNQWFHKESTTKAKQRLTKLTIEALKNYPTEKNRLTIFNYLSVVLANVCNINQQLESNKNNKRLSYMTLPSFEEYQDLGEQAYTPDDILKEFLPQKTLPIQQDLSYQYYIDDNNLKEFLSPDAFPIRSEIEAKQPIEDELSALEAAPKEWQQLLIPLRNCNQIDIYEGRLGRYLDKILHFVDAMKKIFGSKIADEKLAGKTAIARQLQQKLAQTFTKTQDWALSLSQILAQLPTDSLSGDALWITQGYRLACEDLLRRSKITSPLALAECIRQAEANHKLGEYIFSGFDNWLRKLYIITLRHIVDRQGYLLAALKASIIQGSRQPLATVLQQLAGENPSITEGERILIGCLHSGLLNKVFAVIQQKLAAKEFGSNENLLFLLGHVKRFNQANLMCYPFLSELKTTLSHVHYLCKQEQGMKTLVLNCERIQNQVDSLLASQTRTQQSEILNTITQAKEFFANLPPQQFSLKAQKFLAEVQPILVYWLSSLPNFMNNSLFVTSTPIMSSNFLQAFTQHFGNKILEQPSIAQESKVVASFITNKQSSRLEPKPSEDNDNCSDLGVGNGGNNESVNLYLQLTGQLETSNQYRSV